MVQAVAVFGAGVSGIAVASLAKKEGYKIDLFDEREKGCRSDFDESQLDLYPRIFTKPPLEKMDRGSFKCLWRVRLFSSALEGQADWGDWY